MSLFRICGYILVTGRGAVLRNNGFALSTTAPSNGTGSTPRVFTTHREAEAALICKAKVYKHWRRGAIVPVIGTFEIDARKCRGGTGVSPG